MAKISAGKLFDTRVEDYDSFVNGTVIGYEDILGLITELAKLTVKNKAPKVLDLGIGNGNNSMGIFQAFPKARLIGYDLSPKMIDKTRERFSSFDYTGVCDDVLKVNFKDEFDLVVSSIVLHHLSDRDKQEVYKKIFKALKKDGVFILGDLMLSGDLAVSASLKAQWAQHIAYKRGEAYRDKILALDDEHHRYATLPDNLRFLQDVGFNAEVAYRKVNSAVILCRK
jgi:tRNA (cmo5U34)-methyltransferase